MRVLHILSGYLWPNTLPLGFLDAGHEVKTVSLCSEAKLSREVEQFDPDFAITIGWGREQSKANQLVIRKCLKEAGVPHIYWAVEDPGFTTSFTLPLIQRMRPDFIFTICEPKVWYYKQLGFQSAYMDFGFSPHIQYAMECPKEYDIAVIANAYPDILQKNPHHFRCRSLEILVKPLLEKNIRIDFWGEGWEQMGPIMNCRIPTDWVHGFIPYSEANRIYNASRIILGLQNYESQITQRTYEVLGSGGFLLTGDTSGIRKRFTPGEDLVCSPSAEQTPELISFYLQDPNFRESIAARGQSSVQAFSYTKKAEYIIKELQAARII